MHEDLLSDNSYIFIAIDRLRTTEFHHSNCNDRYLVIKAFECEDVQHSAFRRKLCIIDMQSLFQGLI